MLHQRQRKVSDEVALGTDVAADLRVSVRGAALTVVVLPDVLLEQHGQTSAEAAVLAEVGLDGVGWTVEEFLGGSVTSDVVYHEQDRRGEVGADFAVVHVLVGSVDLEELVRVLEECHGEGVASGGSGLVFGWRFGVVLTEMG